MILHAGMLIREIRKSKIIYVNVRGGVMYLYHGTKESYGKQIINQGILKANIKRNYDKKFAKSLRTTDGFVYLTNNLSKATYYGNKNCFIFATHDQEVEENYYIFRIQIDEKELLPDRDELRAYYLPEESDLDISLTKCMSAVVNRDICLKDYNSHYVKIPSSLCKDSSPQLEFNFDFIKLYQIEKRDGLTDYQKDYIKKSYEQFEKLFIWNKL